MPSTNKRLMMLFEASARRCRMPSSRGAVSGLLQCRRPRPNSARMCTFPGFADERTEMIRTANRKADEAAQALRHMEGEMANMGPNKRRTANEKVRRRGTLAQASCLATAPRP